MKRVTLKDVAKAAGVSLASASYAVNKTGSLGQDTRDHILQVAEQLGYRQNMSAKATRTGKTGTIGLVVPDITNPFFPTLAQAVIQRAREEGYSVFVTDTEGSEDLERQALQLLVERSVDGIVWFPIRDENTAGNILDGVPTIVVDRTIAGFESVQADYVEGGRLAAEHLVGLGHRNIGVITGPRDILSMRQRCDAAIACIKEYASLSFVVENGFSTDLEPEVVAALDVASATAIFAGADMIAMGVLKYAQLRGIQVPGQLSIVGFDDIPWAQFSTPTLTTIEMPLEEMAAEAVASILRRMDEATEMRRRVVFDAGLVLRESTAPPGAPRADARS